MTDHWIFELVIRAIPYEIEYGEWADAVFKTFCNFLPWLLFLPLAWRRTTLEAVPERHRALFRGCRLAVLVGFAVFVTMPGTKPRYSLPLFPVASIVVGWTLAVALPSLRRERAWRGVVVVAMIFAAATSVAGVVALRRDPAAVFVAAMTVAMAAAVVGRRRRLNGAVAMTAATGVVTAILVLQYAVFGTVPLSQYEKRRPSGAAINRLVPEGEEVCYVRPGFTSLFFYIDRPLGYVGDIDEVGADTRWVLAQGDAARRLLRRMERAGRPAEIVYHVTSRLAGRHKLVELQPAP